MANICHFSDFHVVPDIPRPGSVLTTPIIKTNIQLIQYLNCNNSPTTVDDGVVPDIDLDKNKQELPMPSPHRGIWEILLNYCDQMYVIEQQLNAM